MKRTDITDLFPEAPKEAIDKLMDLNGADVNAAKSELEALRQQLAAAQKNQGGEELQKAQQQIAQLQTELDGMKAAETIRLTREKVAGEKKIPAHLLTGDTEEACAKQADAILAFAAPNGYPHLPDGGEIHTPPAATPKQKFSEWLEKT